MRRHLTLNINRRMATSCTAFASCHPMLPGQKFPTVLMFPPDIFYLDYGDNGTPASVGRPTIFSRRGSLSFRWITVLPLQARCPGQTSSGRAPAQTDDAKRHILAALDDPQCNGSIYLSVAPPADARFLVGLESTNSAVPLWNNNARLQIKAVVSFPG